MQQPSDLKNLNTILLIIVIILLAVGIWGILGNNKRQSTNTENYNFPTPTDIQSSNPVDSVNTATQIKTPSQPKLATGKTITDSVLGITFTTMNGGTAVKGESRCCPGIWSVHGSDPMNDLESLEMFAPGTVDDPKNWAIATSLGQESYGSNMVNKYKRNDGSYAFTIIKDGKGFLITSPKESPELINLSAIVI